MLGPLRIKNLVNIINIEGADSEGSPLPMPTEHKSSQISIHITRH